MTPPLTYRSYLQLPTLLDLQRPLSTAHDELLFIVIHQSSELWMKLILHELSAARDAIAADNLAPAMKMLARVSRAQTQMIQSWEVLATMTPADYARMRDSLGTSSGFQSDQYRMIEFVLGNRNPAMAALHADEPEVAAGLAAELARPSLYDAALGLLARHGLMPEEALPTDVAVSHVADPRIEAGWAAVYADPQAHWRLYELAEKLVDLEYHLQLWRFGHLKTVERVIGFKQGTGGTGGASYLARVIEQRFFPELLSVRTRL